MVETFNKWRRKMQDNDKENFAIAFGDEFGALLLRGFGEREADEHQLAIIEWAWAKVSEAYNYGYDLGKAEAPFELRHHMAVLKERIALLADEIARLEAKHD